MGANIEITVYFVDPLEWTADKATCFQTMSRRCLRRRTFLTFDRKSAVLLRKRKKGKRSSECVKKTQLRQTMAKTLKTSKQAWERKNASKLAVLACPHEWEWTATVKGRWSSISLDHPRLLLDLDYEPHTVWLTSIPQCLFQYDSVLNSISMTDRAESNRGGTCRERNGSRCITVERTKADNHALAAYLIYVSNYLSIELSIYLPMTVSAG